MGYGVVGIVRFARTVFRNIIAHPCPVVVDGSRKPNFGGQLTAITELTVGTCALDDISKENLEPEVVAHSTDQLLPR